MGDLVRCTAWPAGVPCIMDSAGCAPVSDPSGLTVLMTPGDMALTLTPEVPNSADQALVKVSMAPFVHDVLST